ncbi:MAG: iron-containing redox enzyme family protein [Pirellulaceae bacterium]
MSSRSDRLNFKISLLRPEMQAAAARLYLHERFDELFPHFLCTVHTTIRASVPMMEMCERRCRELVGKGDPIAEQLAEYYAEHAVEEQHHDTWLLEDIETLGLDPKEVVERVPSPAAAALVGSQYYWIENYHPVAFLGYLAVLERPFDQEYFRRLGRKWNIPESGFRTILLHAELDDGHREELDELIDALPLTDAQEQMLGISVIATAAGTASLFNDIVDQFERTCDTAQCAQL